MSFEHTPAEHIDNLFTAFTSLPACKTRSQSFVNWIEPIKNQSHSAIAWSKMDLMFVYIKCNDEVSLLVLEQDWWKSFYRPNRFAKSSNFSEQPVRSLNLFLLWKDSCLWKNSAKKATSSFSKIRALNGLNSKMYYICHPIFFMNKLENVWLLDYSA